MKLSYGIISFIIDDNKIKYLVCQRKDSFHFLNLLKKFNTMKNKEVLDNIKNLTKDECNRIISHDFTDTWDDLYINNIYRSYIIQKTNVFNNFNMLKKKYIKEIKEQYNTSNVILEWGFPKGGKIKFESDLNCALREWVEETTIKKDELNIINTDPFSYNILYENFQINVKCFLAKINIEINVNPKKTKLRSYISKEIGSLKWGTLEELKSYLSSNIIEELEKVEKFISIFLLN